METQTTIFEFISPTFKITKPVRLIEMFAGIGSQAKALENLGVEFEHWKVIEFDKHAVDSYNAVHGTQFHTSDIRNVHAADLELIERESMLHTHVFIPVPRFEPCRKSKRHAKGSGHAVRASLGSRTHFRRMRHRVTARVIDGKRAASNRE